MPLNLIFGAILALIDLLRITLITAIPAFLIALAGEQLHLRLSKRFSLSWAKSTAISTYLIVTLLIMVLYLVPLYIGFSESPLTGIPTPEVFQVGLLETVVAGVIILLRLLVIGILFTLLLLPFLFFSSYALEKSRERLAKRIPGLVHKFVATFATALLAWIVLLFVFPWALGGLLYLLYFA